jgi:hypothetical protein
MTEEIKEILDMFTKYKDDWYSCEYKLKPKQCVILYDYITNLQKENELHNKILKDANDVLNIQAQKGNYNYDSYMLGLYNGMEMIVSLFEQREPKFKSGKDIKFLHETDYKSRNEKAVEYIKNTTLYGFRSGKTLLSNYLDDLLNILQGGDE